MDDADRPSSPDIDLSEWHRAIGTIVAEWARVGNLLRRAVNTLAETHPGISRLGTGSGFEARVTAWSRALDKVITDTKARGMVQNSVRNLRDLLTTRNMLCHGEMMWRRNMFGKPVAIFVLETLPQEEKSGSGRRSRSRRRAALPAEARIPGTSYGADLLDPSQYHAAEYELGDLTDAARAMTKLRKTVEQLSHRVAPDAFVAPPHPSNHNQASKFQVSKVLAGRALRRIARLTGWRRWKKVLRQFRR